jgi:hypothetical protein
MQAKDGRVMKFMARYDGLDEVLEAFPNTFIYKIHLPDDRVTTLSKLQIHLQYMLRPLSKHPQHIFRFYFTFSQLISHLHSSLGPQEAYFGNFRLISDTSHL